jgi:hypothetical protein
MTPLSTSTYLDDWMKKKRNLILGTQAPQPSAVNLATLTPLVQRALHSDSIKVVNWQREQLHGGVGRGTAIYRYSGDGQDHGQIVPWSLILKALQPNGSNSLVSAWDYYKREADAYQSGWLDDLPGGLVAPCTFGVTEAEDGRCWMWLEDVTNEIGSPWPLEHYRVVARHLGQFNGVYLTQKSLPKEPWMSRDWLRQYVEQSAQSIELLNNSRDHQLVRHWMPGDMCEGVLRLWEDRDVFLDALDQLPQTICHFDVHRRNLFARRMVDCQDQTVLIDWAFAGPGPIGADLNPLVWASVAFFDVDFDQMQRLEHLVFNGYIDGLHDMGWQGDPQHVRLGFTASSIRYMLGGITPVLTMILDRNRHTRVQQAFQCTIEELLDHWGKRARFTYLDEARRLIDVLC